MKKSVVGEVQEGILVRPERYELPTYCSGGNRSIHLSYGRPNFSLHGKLRRLNDRYLRGIISRKRILASYAQPPTADQNNFARSREMISFRSLK